MTNEEYVQAALRTESLSDEVRLRFSNPEYITALVIHIDRLMEDIRVLDVFKKFMFYGKWNEVMRDLVPAFSPVNLDPMTRPEDSVIRLVHSAMGVATEAGELLEALGKHLPGGNAGKDLDRTNLIEEVGDAFWYQAIAADALKTSFEEIQSRNIAKLKARYPGKFEKERAVERDLEREREALTNGQ